MTLAGNQTKRVTVNLKIPEQGFTGVLLGGLYLVDQEETAGTTGDGVQFKLPETLATVVGLPDGITADDYKAITERNYRCVQLA